MSEAAIPSAMQQEDLIAASLNKLEETLVSFQQQGDDDSFAAVSRLQATTKPQGYRCRCSFQIVRDDHNRLCYAIRENGIPIIVDAFPVANQRIQEIMPALLQSLQDDSNPNLLVLRKHLTSVTFVTTWKPERTCLVTLHYDAPLSRVEHAWTEAAYQVATKLGLQQLSGRSKGCVLVARHPAYNGTLEDTIYLQYCKENGWKVSLDEMDLLVQSASTENPILSVEYSKPEDAFAHPNATVMCQALGWMLNCIQNLKDMHATPTPLETHDGAQLHRPTLLELYCGCGAHTMALAKSGLLEQIVAVELDERLIKAFRQNVLRNKLDACHISIISQDAGTWATAAHNGKHNKSNEVGALLLETATILLVDPPRQGLDARVCQMALESTNLQHLLYISCGRDALLRDLDILRSGFEVMDCFLLDLFPQTYSVESLVYLKRRTVSLRSN